MRKLILGIICLLLSGCVYPPVEDSNDHPLGPDPIVTAESNRIDQVVAPTNAVPQ